MKLCLGQGQSLKTEIRLRLDQLEIAGGASESIFPEVEKKLASGGSKHFRALKSIAKGEEDVGFHSVIDFLFVATFPAFRDRCLAFYSGESPALCALISEPARAYAELRMLALLEVAVVAGRGKISLVDAVALVDLLEVA